MDKLAIVILNWNGEEMLKKYLPAVMQYSREEAQIYVADNASTDGSLNLLAQDSPSATSSDWRGTGALPRAITRHCGRLMRNTTCC